MKSHPEQLGHDAATGRNLVLWSASVAPDVREAKDQLVARPFACLLVWDAASESTEAIANVTDTLLRAGCVYLCTWGADCERVHDICDEGIVEMQLSDELSDHDEDLVMTTWHDSEPLDEALWFFLRSTTPAENYSGSCRVGLVLTVGQGDERVRVIREALEAPDAFARKIESRPDIA